MGIVFKQVELEHMESIRTWRNQQLEILRTSKPISQRSQIQYFNRISDRDSNNRMFSVLEDTKLIGMTGLENIQWENRLAEISIITDPFYSNRLEIIINKVLDCAFNTFNLNTVFTEVYHCNSHFKSWKNLNYIIDTKTLPTRKFWDGEYYNSEIITFGKIL